MMKYRKYGIVELSGNKLDGALESCAAGVTWLVIMSGCRGSV